MNYLNLFHFFTSLNLFVFLFIYLSLLGFSIRAHDAVFSLLRSRGHNATSGIVGVTQFIGKSVNTICGANVYLSVNNYYQLLTIFLAFYFFYILSFFWIIFSSLIY